MLEGHVQDNYFTIFTLVAFTCAEKTELQCNNSPRATIAHLRVNKYSHWTKWVYFCLFVCFSESQQVQSREKVFCFFSLKV